MRFQKDRKYLADNDESDEIDVDVEVEAVGREVTEARKLGITPGKLNLIEKLKTVLMIPMISG